MQTTPEHISRITRRKDEMLDKWMERPSFPGEIVLYNAWVCMLKIFEEQQSRKEREEKPPGAVAQG